MKAKVPMKIVHHVLILASIDHCPGVSSVGNKETIADKESHKSSAATSHLDFKE